MNFYRYHIQKQYFRPYSSSLPCLEQGPCGSLPRTQTDQVSGSRPSWLLHRTWQRAKLDMTQDLAVGQAVYFIGLGRSLPCLEQCLCPPCCSLTGTQTDQVHSLCDADRPATSRNKGILTVELGNTQSGIREYSVMNTEYSVSNLGIFSQQ